MALWLVLSSGKVSDGGKVKDCYLSQTEDQEMHLIVYHMYLDRKIRNWWVELLDWLTV